MDDVKHAIPILVAGILSTVVATAHGARADDTSPLYRLVDTAAQRLATADAVAASKWIDGGPITDPQRANQVLDNVGADATARGVDPAFVRKIFANQIDATEGIEYARFGQWKLDPAAAPTAAPDLTASRAAIDGYNREMVNEIALHRDSFTATDCPVVLDSAIATVTAERSLDPLYHQALAFATHSYCGS